MGASSEGTKKPEFRYILPAGFAGKNYGAAIHRLFLKSRDCVLSSLRMLYDKFVFRLRAIGSSSIGAIRANYWRMLGMNVGAGTLLPRVHVTWPHQVRIGPGCLIEHGVYFHYDGIWAPGPCIRIGESSFVGTGTEFNIRVGISIGANSLIAAGCRFVDHDHGFGSLDLPMGVQPGAEACIELGSDVWIGANCVVLKGVRIGNGAIVGAGSVVNRSIGEHEIWAGVPARFIRHRIGDASPPGCN
ncbi:MAG TPA: acyltransferase [Steroidobacteraceae bacterium]|nr:acyltransferase [Steroidobacteraceae bacterium]